MKIHNPAFLTKMIVSVLLFSFSVSAQALMVTDVKTWGLFGEEISQGETYKYVHDLTDSGVPDLYEVESANLMILFRDDLDLFKSEKKEKAFVTTVDFTSDTFKLNSGPLSFTIFSEAIGTIGLLSLNTSGLIEVMLTSVVGDFQLMGSKLSAKVQAVDGPETLALFSIGLAGLVWFRRRKANRLAN